MSGDCTLIGHTSLTLEAARMLRAAGHPIRAVATRFAPLRDWAAAEGVALHDPDAPEALPETDWLFSIGHLAPLPEAALARARRGAINFHDGPLPARGGLNAPVWALLEGAKCHSVTWHLMTARLDAGDILEERGFAIAPGETAATLNARCFAAGLESFPAVLGQLRDGLRRRPQTAPRRMHRAADRPPADALIAPGSDVAAALRLVRALDHGRHPNPVTRAKIRLGGQVLLVGTAAPADATAGAAPGRAFDATADAVTVRLADGALRLAGLARPDGAACDVAALVAAGARLEAPADPEGLGAAMRAAARHEAGWRDRLMALRPADLPGLCEPAEAPGAVGRLPLELPEPARSQATAAWAAIAVELADGPCDLALHSATGWPGHLADWLPLRVAGGETTEALRERIAAAHRTGGFAADLPARMPGSGVRPPRMALGPDLPAGAVAGLDPEGTALLYDPARLPKTAREMLAARLCATAEALAAGGTGRPGLAPAEQQWLETWNATQAAIPKTTVQAEIAAQAARQPEATALIHRAERLSYAGLEARANRMAHVLRAMGAGPGHRVGLHLERSIDMVVAMLAVLNAGAAYVPLDPGYPADRLALYAEDSGATVIVSAPALAGRVPPSDAALLLTDDPRLAVASEEALPDTAGPGDLAYLIYTSGSTGRPKGVMITHRNLANFRAAMDDRIGDEAPGRWLAVTSISFDISVLELLWTLSRGHAVVVQGEADRTLPSADGAGRRGMALSLFYWGHEGGGDPDYRLLTEGARFADAQGFEAVWTPERHFHGFGAPYPNPAVTGAAVAAITRRVAIRAGSCVAPLHHPARIAEDWAVVDRLSGGRAGIAMAAGWQPDDFVLRPEAAPPDHRAALGEAIDKVRRLWRGETVAFPRADGSLQQVATRPRPVSAELPLWLTIAGNPESWREAGRLGANVLTHMLGQDLGTLERHIGLWRAALAEAGHAPERFRVTVMLHSYLAESRAAARAAVRGPMKAYLASAAGLIARHAAAFPAFSGGGTDPDALTEAEREAVLEHAFARYFEKQGLFGTVEDGLARLAELRAIGVGEVACLIDFGLETETALDGLPRLAELLRRAPEVEPEAEPGGEDWSIAAQIRRHGVTHLQCTPSMARMLLADEGSRAALAGLRRLLVGGEALPGALVEDLARATPARIENMYGPTETTIWSTSGEARPGAAVASIGRPLRNTSCHVLDEAMAPLPAGVTGELWIGGAGVAAGYWRRDELTAERFRPDPSGRGRIYRTGDLARWRWDGRLEFLGRADHQVKLRGHRIELGEIEAALDARPGIRQSVVVSREDRPGLQRLVAYVEAEGPVDETALRAALAARLPEVMVPARIVRLDAFPLTPNRKIDRKALPEPAPRRAGPGAAAARPVPAPLPDAPAPAARPAGEATAAIAAIWSDLLGVESPGAEDDFFALGGHSLLAVEAHRRIRAELAAPDLAITDIFRFTRLGDLAARLEAGRAPAPTPERSGDSEAAETTRRRVIERRRALRARRDALG
ncbi:MupA/Atu3671 family FMN-dependent luciferase-like monooxygenase [Limimaricola pyoseonensis]|uniref:Natural product biosynthesis luciferase-like monooxygenase domain-containing protein n=1 Tax=Limimaricola pyoseonensis TaxID=521013 RepID=A0A1G7K2P4_9RHOB|nr:MupA/Atu3671 family FMN-dependent luciferase-like monooxygenase [Limimaricola pyoseonensis]SDF31284.1 natural product biosynthesis luciferase-like monooxygenase domain-containing protein [Limimaricola pyoseonensis]